MATNTAPQSPRGFKRGLRKVYQVFGFKKGYNAVLAFLALGYILGFSLSRLQYLSYPDVFCGGAPGNSAAPGECFYYLQPPFQIGMMLHLFTILPAGVLVVLQFIPAIRYKAILFHRINGYLVLLLSLVSSAGALIATPHAFGGDMATRTLVGVLVISTTVSYLLAWINIKRLQIDQHRAWMMRAWTYFAVIITLRIIMIISAQIITGFSTPRPCAQLAFQLGANRTRTLYPSCQAFVNGTDPHAEALVHADFTSQDNSMEISTALGVTFGAAGWVALWLHAIAIEVYLRLTPVEAERLRHVSYERQLERGFTHPGSAGLVAQRLGDAKPFLATREQQGPDASKGEGSGTARG